MLRWLAEKDFTGATNNNEEHEHTNFKVDKSTHISNSGIS